MAKVAFSKLKCKVNSEYKTIHFADEAIEVRQYLPIQEKLEMLSKVAQLAHEEDYNFSNFLKMKVFLKLHIVFYYTNISFSAKNLEDMTKLYDSLVGSGLMHEIINALPDREYIELEEDLVKILESIYKYQYSVYGVLESFNAGSVSSDEILKLQEQVEDLEKSNLVQKILPLLGSNEIIEEQ